MAPQLGRLHWVFNVDRRFGAATGYWRVLVLTKTGPEVLLFTPAELDAVRARAASNPEETLLPSWWDFAWSKLCALWAEPRGHRALREG